MKKDILIDNKLIKKVLIIAGISGLVLGLLIVALVSVNNFYKDNYLEFRSPFQSPIVIKAREMPQKQEIEEEVEDLQQEEQETETEVEETAYVPSSNTLALIQKNPGLAGKIKQVFGDEWRQAAELIARESSFNPHAINPTSGACGLAQALPCNKMACELSDVHCQLEWISEYVQNRYGNMENTLAFHDQKGWY